MPHKHVRHKDDDPSRYDLPPTIKARPLPVGRNAQTVFTATEETEKRKNKRKKQRQGDDDTPKAFARMMAWQQQRSTGEKRRTGLDDGEPRRPAKKQKQTPKQTQSQPQNTKQTSKSSNDTPSSIRKAPQILPNESLADFSARVDQSLPLSHLSRKPSAAAKNLSGVPKERQTKTERRMQKMYAAWRVEEEKRKEREEEAREQAEESEDERDAEYGLRPKVTGRRADDDDDGDAQEDGAGGSRTRKRGKKNRKPRLIGETVSDDDDPWAVLSLKKGAKPAGLHDVAQAPPEFKTLPREKFKVRNLNGAFAQVADVPGKAGSLKRREELGETRREVIERYRAMMGRGGGL